MNEEIFLPVNGFEELYEISNLGRLKSLPKTRGANFQKLPEKILKLQMHTGGYSMIMLNKNGVKKRFFIHRLVAIHFVPNPNNLPEVNHIDGDKLNCAASNLEWVTRLENEQHACRTGLKSMKGTKHFASRPIVQFSLDGIRVSEFENGTDMENKTNFDRSVIQRCCRGNIKQAYGFKWEYKWK
jgi:hypothetical protein